MINLIFESLTRSCLEELVRVVAPTDNAPLVGDATRYLPMLECPQHRMDIEAGSPARKLAKVRV